MATALLEGVRVLDLTDYRGHLCGRVLADLGAEVIKVEPPGGDPARQRGPFKGEQQHPEASLYFINFNTNKKSITLDLADPHEHTRFLSLVRTADVVLESFSPRELDLLRLDPTHLHRQNPGLVVGTLSGFGRTGLYKDYKAPPLVISAMGGVMNLCGKAEREPLAEPAGVSFQTACVALAFGVLAALYHRRRTGHGQRVEVSAYEVQASLEHNITVYSAGCSIPVRRGNQTPGGGSGPRGIYPCKDGHTHIVVISPGHWKSFLEWIGRPEPLQDPKWENRHIRGQHPDFLDTFVLELTRDRTRAQLFAEGQKHHVTVAPVNTPADFARDPHVQGRDLFTTVEHPRVGTCPVIKTPGKMSQTPPRIQRPAPLLGQHNREVLEAGLASQVPRPSGGTASTVTSGRRLLEGVRVLDFTFALAGPLMTRWLGELGAEVIKVESHSRQQRGRSRPGLPRNVVRQQRATFAEVERNKLCITLNMNTEQGQEIARRLVAVSDVVAENFSPRVVERWGLDYEQVRQIRPDIVMARLPAFGLKGPYRDYVGLNSVSLAFTGMASLWGYHDDPTPNTPVIWIPDFLSSAYSAVAVMGAIMHREATGTGQLIEVAQIDATAAMLGVEFLEYFVNGRQRAPLGNRSLYAAPHGCYPCKGDNRWCVIAVETEEEWRALVEVLGQPEWAGDPSFATPEGRLRHQDMLDQHIAEWTRRHTPHQVMHLLQGAGVPAGAVQNAEDLVRDPQLRSRGFLVPLDGTGDEPIEYPGLTVRLSETPGHIEPCASLGQHNDYIFRDVLGASPDQVQAWIAAGVLS